MKLYCAKPTARDKSQVCQGREQKFEDTCRSRDRKSGDGIIVAAKSCHISWTRYFWQIHESQSKKCLFLRWTTCTCTWQLVWSQTHSLAHTHTHTQNTKYCNPTANKVNTKKSHRHLFIWLLCSDLVQLHRGKTIVSSCTSDTNTTIAIYNVIRIKCTYIHVSMTVTTIPPPPTPPGTHSPPGLLNSF